MVTINVKKADISNLGDIKECILEGKLDYFSKTYAKDTKTLIKTLLEKENSLYGWNNSIVSLKNNKIELMGITATKAILDSFQELLDRAGSSHKSFTNKMQGFFNKSNPVSVEKDELYLEILGRNQEKPLMDTIIKYAKIEVLQKKLNSIVVFIEKDSYLLPAYKALGFIQVESISSFGLSKGEYVKLKVEVR